MSLNKILCGKVWTVWLRISNILISAISGCLFLSRRSSNCKIYCVGQSQSSVDVTVSGNVLSTVWISSSIRIFVWLGSKQWTAYLCTWKWHQMWLRWSDPGLHIFFFNFTDKIRSLFYICGLLLDKWKQSLFDIYSQTKRANTHTTHIELYCMHKCYLWPCDLQ